VLHELHVLHVLHVLQQLLRREMIIGRVRQQLLVLQHVVVQQLLRRRNIWASAVFTETKSTANVAIARAIAHTSLRLILVSYWIRLRDARPAGGRAPEKNTKRTFRRIRFKPACKFKIVTHSEVLVNEWHPLAGTKFGPNSSQSGPTAICFRKEAAYNLQFTYIPVVGSRMLGQNDQ
jgi:hypothetical protein